MEGGIVSTLKFKMQCLDKLAFEYGWKDVIHCPECWTLFSKKKSTHKLQAR
jgi:hypothetical protein